MMMMMSFWERVKHCIILSNPISHLNAVISIGENARFVDPLQKLQMKPVEHFRTRPERSANLYTGGHAAQYGLTMNGDRDQVSIRPC